MVWCTLGMRKYKYYTSIKDKDSPSKCGPKKSSKSRKCFLSMFNKTASFFQWTQIISMGWWGMFRHLIGTLTDLKPRKFIKKGEQNEIAEELCPSTGQPASQREVLPFIQDPAQMFNNLPSHIQLSHTHTHGDIYEKIGLSVSQNIISIKPSPQQIGPCRAERCVQEEGIKHNEWVNGIPAGRDHSSQICSICYSLMCKGRNTMLYKYYSQ